MEVYFVRHGETDGNLAKRHQVEISKLTSKGKQQAKDVSIVLKNLSPTHLVTSTHIRAIETAQIISDEIDLVPETSQLFTELHRPKNIYGHYHYGLKSFYFIVRWYLGLTGGDVNSDDGESYASLRTRISAAKFHLENLPEDSRVIVVSHALFISLFMAHVCQEKPLSLIQAIKYWTRLTSLKNTTVKHLSVVKVEDGCGWNFIEN
jgi:probable phosphoglycerate mutase